ncbi:hypothetical protein MXM41_08740 [Leclercia adecarboxylata]|uniref:hypothetical protein n=1 Tax=Leclercia adecarboxylata TaxID=83655 RepID=UPI002DB56BDB|nr:hypothetical protein [Leclercia adecarboxylata]MEB6379021.1 hypothetical protein [Leclercia adecarboxylata]
MSEDVEVNVNWLPFERNPGMPLAGMDRLACRRAKFGSWAYSHQLDEHTAEKGKRTLSFLTTRLFPGLILPRAPLNTWPNDTDKALAEWEGEQIFRGKYFRKLGVSMGDRLLFGR